MNTPEDFRIEHRIGRTTGTGTYEITRQGTRREIRKYVETYKTPSEELEPDKWKKKALEAIKASGEEDILEKVKAYCKEHCAWLKTEKEIEEYAIECHCCRAYEYWERFFKYD